MGSTARHSVGRHQPRASQHQRPVLDGAPDHREELVELHRRMGRELDGLAVATARVGAVNRLHMHDEWIREREVRGLLAALQKAEDGEWEPEVAALPEDRE